MTYNIKFIIQPSQYNIGGSIDINISYLYCIYHDDHINNKNNMILHLQTIPLGFRLYYIYM